MNLAKWTLRQLQFLLSHIEELVGEDRNEIRDQMALFEPQTGLNHIDTLDAGTIEDPLLPARAFEKLAPFYEAGFLAVKDDANVWSISHLFWKGQVFELEEEEQPSLNQLVGDISPLQVQRADAARVLNEMGFSYLQVPSTAKCFLFKPSFNAAYILVSDLPELWSEDHVTATHRLLSQSFQL